MGSRRCTSNIDYISPKQRQDVICEILYHRGFTTVKSLASRFEVSEKTIRRDVTELMRSAPIEITRGRNAVIRVTEGCELKEPIYNLLNPREKEYLQNLVEIVPKESLAILKNIIAKVAS